MKRCRPLAGLAFVAVGATIPGCFGEGSVFFAGSVTEGSEAGHSFDQALNPAKRPPVAGAAVHVYVDEGSCADPGQAVAADGVFSTDEVVYGGTGCSSSTAVVCIRAPGFESLRLEFPTSDSSRTDGKRFLNVVLKKK